MKKLFFAFALLSTLYFSSSSWALTFSVTNANDGSGNGPAGSLRQAIFDACVTNGNDTVTLGGIPGQTVHLIAPITISGCAGDIDITFSQNSIFVKPVIDGSSVPNNQCAIIVNDANKISIHDLRFSGGNRAICLQGNGSIIANNDIQNTTGAAIEVTGNNNVIATNTIKNNQGIGVHIKGGDNNSIQTTNLIDHNNAEGILLSSGASGNGIGNDPNSGMNNTITFNGKAGIGIVGSGTIKNTISYNVIHSNKGLGIDLGNDSVANNGGNIPNNGINFPTSLQTTPINNGWIVSGVAKAGATIEIFKVDSPTGASDPSTNQGEGLIRIASGQASVQTGKFSVTITGSAFLHAGDFLSMTATHASDGTSEFSGNVKLDTVPFPCGNGVLDAGEQCDEGPNAQCCDSTCKIKPASSSCSDGVLFTFNDQCNGQTGKDTDCHGSPLNIPFCGDGVTNNGEQCDDGNLVNGDGCDINCTNTTCGNGITTAGEQCDDGNLVDNDACRNDCTLPVTVCGDGVIQGNEQCDDNGQCCVQCVITVGAGCDDGNPLSLGDVCTAQNTCVGILPICGNGITEGNEQCDDSSNPCCNQQTCLFQPSGFVCDDGNPLSSNDICNGVGNCFGSLGTCGNGSLNVGEDCDSSVPGTVCCDPTCHFQPSGFVCDDGNPLSSNDICNGAGGCSGIGSVCGNGNVDGNEQCDDPLNPCCDQLTCMFVPSGQICDDNNPNLINDVCDAAGNCSGVPPVCGNGVIEGAEQCDDPFNACCNPVTCLFEASGVSCDDGNPVSLNDECNGFGSCFGSLGTCGNGSLNAGEDCDSSVLGTVCCDPTCHFQVSGISCDDGDALTLGDSCNGAGDCSGTLATCGNGVFDLGEACDASVPGTVCCNAFCQLESAGVSCDDGNPLSSNDICNAQGSCSGTIQICGDGIVNGNEQCDGGQCCNQNCTFKAIGTVCDDGNSNTSFDECSVVGPGICQGTPNPVGGAVNPPINLGATTSTDPNQSPVTVTFTDDSTNEDGFHIDRADGACSSNSQFTTVGTVTTPSSTGSGETVTFNDTSAIPGQTYCYQATAFNNTDTSLPSNQVTVIAADPATSPGGLLSSMQGSGCSINPQGSSSPVTALFGMAMALGLMLEVRRKRAI